MYLRAGLLDGEGQQGVLAAIAVDPELTIAQKQSLTQIYETFRRENARSDDESTSAEGATAVIDSSDRDLAHGGPVVAERDLVTDLLGR